MAPAKVDKLRGRISINPDEVPPPPAAAAPAAVAPAAAPEPEQEPAAAVPAPTDPARAETSSAPRTRRPRKRGSDAALASAPEPDAEPAAARKDYRSFYVSDDPYGRFRAAMYWLGRTPEVVDELGGSMSSAVEQFMVATAEDLERRFNKGKPFREPPKAARSRKSD